MFEPTIVLTGKEIIMAAEMGVMRQAENLRDGWIYGREGKLEKFWKDPAGGRPAFFVPNEALSPINELKACVWEERLREVLTTNET